MAESMELFGMTELEIKVAQFMLKYLVPLPIVRRSYKLRLLTELTQRKSRQLKELPLEVSDVLFIGSQYEGLSVTVTSVDGGDAIAAMSDFDTMPVLKRYQASDRMPSKVSVNEEVDILELCQASHSGYCRLRSTKTGKFVGMSFDPDCSGKVNIYYDGAQASETNVPYTGVIPGFPKQSKTLEMKTYVHGPAIACTKIQVHPGSITRTGQEVDVVLSIKCQDWPLVASEWFKRQESKSSRWPSSKTIEKIKSTECYVVAVPHPLSSSPREEWRYSFAPAEKILARSLTFAQKGSYIIAKMLFKTALENVDKMSSYCLKTQMFWLCEEESSPSWTYAKVGYYALRLLSQLAESLTNGVLRQYFIPENNIIGHITAPTFCEVAETLNELVKNPFPVMKKIRRTTKFFGTIEHPPEESFQSVISLLNVASASDNDIKNRFRSSKVAIIEHYYSMLKKPIASKVQEEFSKLKFAVLMDIAEDIGNEKDLPDSTDDIIDKIAKEVSKYSNGNMQKWAAFVEEYWKCLEKLKSENVEQMLTQTFDGILKIEAF